MGEPPRGEPLRVAIVGAGWMGQVHAGAVRAAGDAVTAVVDTDMHRARWLAAECGLAGDRAYASVEHLLSGTADERPSAAVIASPSAAHLRQVADLVEAEIPLLVEKPPWTAGQDPAPVFERIAARRVPVLVGMTTRFEPGIHALHDAARAGEFGRVLSITDEIYFQLADDQLAAWYAASPQAGGGIVLTNGVHAVDRVGWILGEPLRLGSAALATVDDRRESEDFAALTLAPCGRDGPVDLRVTLLWSRYQPPPSRLQVIGSEGTGWADGSGRWVIHGRSGPVHGRRPPGHDNHHAQWLSFRAGLGMTGAGMIAPSGGPLANYTELAGVMKVLDEVLRPSP